MTKAGEISFDLTPPPEAALAPAAMAALLLGIAFVLAIAVWPLRNREPSGRLAGLVPVAVIILALPWLAPTVPVVPRAVVALGCVGGLAAKLADLHRNAERWRRRTFRDWLFFVPNPLVLVDWRRRLQPARPLSNAIRWLSRGTLEMTAGFLVLRWAFSREFGPGGFWLEHGVKALGSYLLIFDGAFVLATGLCRLVGFRVMDFSRNPILAATPAEFWRRYNRDAGVGLHEHVFLPSGGLRRPARGILLVFLVNGLIHEYLALLMTGHVSGFQTAFFVIHGAAVASTFRLRPRGAGRVLGGCATFVFLYVTTMLFFATIDEIVPWWYE